MSNIVRSSLRRQPAFRRQLASRRRRLQLESLEARQLFASDVIQVVFAIADSTVSPTNAGLIFSSDLDARTCSPLRNPFFFDGQGFDGLAFDNRSQLWATTSSGIRSPSFLVHLAFSSGQILSSIPITSAGLPQSIGDLAFDSATNTMLGIRSASDSSGGGGELYKISLASGVATLVGDTGLEGHLAIGISSSGTLYATSYNATTNTASLHQLNHETATVMSSVVLSNPLGALGSVIGLSNETVDGTFIASDAATSEVVSIDPVTGVRTLIDIAGAPSGVAGDLALIPIAHSRDIVYQQDFERGGGGFTIDNSGGTIPGLWHLSVGRRDDGLINHTRVNSFYYGSFENAEGRGTYLRPFDHQGVILSPEIIIPDAGKSTLSFNYLLETRPELDRDFVEVAIDNGSTITQIFSRQDGTLPQTGRTKWLTATSDLSAFIGQTIRVRFRFDTGDTPSVDPEGWYVDDIKITHISSADTSVDKTIDDPTPNVGQTVTYTITASSSDVSLTTATGVIVTDRLPPELTFVSAVASEGIYDEVTGLWDGIELKPGEVQKLTIAATVNAGTAGISLVNVTTINGDQVDTEPTDNTATQTSTINSVDLSVTKTVDDETPNIRQSVTYTIQAFNAATSNAVATGVSVLEMLPSQVTFVSASSTDFNPVTQVWTVGDVPAGAMKSLQITVIVNERLAGACVANTVTISGNETDPDLSNNMFTQMLTPNNVDLSITKTTDNEKPNVGQSVTYTLTATNALTSNVIATGVKVQEAIPSGVTYASTSSTDFDPITQVWMVGDLAIGETKTLMITVSVNPNTAGELLNNTVTINGNETDPDPSNNMVTQMSTVHSVDVSVMKNANKRTPTEGERVTFTITVHNDTGSNNDASNVVVTDVLPAGVTFVSFIATEGSYDSRTHQWTGVDLSRNETQTLTIVVDIKAGTGGTTITNATTIKADETDPVPTNNQSSVNLMVQQQVRFIAPIGLYRPGQFVIPAEERREILGRVWVDTNGDGIWDSTEKPLDGVKVELLRGTTVVSINQTRAADVDGDGKIDLLTEHGVYWFQASAEISPGDYTVRLVFPDAETPSVVTTNQTVASRTGEYAVTIGSASPALSSNAFEDAISNFGVRRDFVLQSATGTGVITGHTFADLNLNGIQDVGEPDRDGFLFFLDVKENGELDLDENEPTAFSGADGRFYFADVPVKDTPYVLREAFVGTAALPRITTPPAAALPPLPVDPTVIESSSVIAASVTVQSDQVTNVSAVGVFEYADFVRPADQFAARTADIGLVSSLKAWQSFKIENTTGTSLQITSIDTTGISGTGMDYVSVMQFDGNTLVPVIPDFELAVGETVEYMAFYDPAERDENGNVTRQSPDWLGLKTAVHNFAATDKLVVKTSVGLAFPVQLIGGSTFDSDVSYDGKVDNDDFNLLDTLLKLEPVIEQLAQDGITRSPRFDPTMDINVRCPNGAESVTGMCRFAIGGTPSREIAFGDFGPLNHEYGLPIKP